MLFFLLTHYAFGGVADLLAPSSSLFPFRCARGTAGTSVLPFCVLQRYVYRGQLRSSFRRPEHLPASPFFSMVSLVCLGPLVFISVFVFWFGSSPFSRRLALCFLRRSVAVLPGSSSWRYWGAQFRWIPGFTGFSRISECGGNVAQIPHAELSSNVLMEPACHLANYVDSRITSFHTQVRWGDTGPNWGGYSSGSFLKQFFEEPFFSYCLFLQGEMSTHSGFLFLFQGRSATARSH